MVRKKGVRIFRVSIVDVTIFIIHHVSIFNNLPLTLNLRGFDKRSNHISTLYYVNILKVICKYTKVSFALKELQGMQGPGMY